MIIGVRWERADIRGCCANPGRVMYNDWVDSLDACKRMCFADSNCGWINFSDDNPSKPWCTLIPKTSDCSELDSGRSDCGAGGHIFYVYKYLPRHGNTLVAFI